MRDAGRLLVWAGIWDVRIIRPFHGRGNLNAESYLNMFEEVIFPSVLNGDGDSPVDFQQDDAPSHYGSHARHMVGSAASGCLDWLTWSRRSGLPDLRRLDFFLCGHSRATVYQEKIRDQSSAERYWRRSYRHNCSYADAC